MLFRRRGKHRIKITFEFSVVDLAFFIGFSAEEPLEVVYGSKRVATPFVEILNRFTVISVKFFDLSSFGKSFAVGRVGNNHPVGKPRGKFAHVRPLKVNHILNARDFGVFPGKFKLLFVDIEAAYANFSVRVYSGRGFFLNLVENRSVRTFPVKIIEISVHSARDVRRNERRLDGYRTRAAKNIGERS